MCASSAPAATASSTPSFSTRAVSRPSRAIASCACGSPARCRSWKASASRSTQSAPPAGRSAPSGACALRSPAPFTEQGFREFNEVYAAKLKEWALYDGSVNPVARSNVCPALNPPSQPSLHAFCYTDIDGGESRSFIVAGSGEAPEGKPNYRDFIVRRGDVTPAGLREKARFVLATMEARLAALGFTWADTTATQVYTVQDLHPFLADEIVRRGAAHAGLTWHYCRPPVVGLEYEMDCRGVGLERTLPASAF